MMRISNRRWIQICLSALFVLVVVFACWLRYEVSWVHERHVMLARHHALGADLKTESMSAPLNFTSYVYHRLRLAPDADKKSWNLLWLFGEKDVAELRLFFRNNDEKLIADEVERARQIFPELRDARLTGGPTYMLRLF